MTACCKACICLISSRPNLKFDSNFKEPAPVQLRQEVEAPRQGVLPLVALLGEPELEPCERSLSWTPRFEPTGQILPGCLSLLRVRVRFNDHRGHLRKPNRKSEPVPQSDPTKHDSGQAPWSSKNTIARCKAAAVANSNTLLAIPTHLIFCKEPTADG